jgi:glycosyltransferase involved in cell wall biosynthesis
MFKRLDSYNKVIVTSFSGKLLCERQGLDAEYLITTKEKKLENVIFTYLARTFIALTLRIEISEGDILYSSSDFFPDVIPVFLNKIFKRKVKWVQKVFHLIPKRRFIPYFAQKFSFFLIKNLADLIIVDSYLLQSNLLKQAFISDKIRVSYPGIGFKDFPIETNSPKKDYDGIFLGRFHVSKGIFDLVEIWKFVSLALPHAKLAIIGRGENSVSEALKNKIRDLSLTNNIEVLGYLAEERKSTVLNSGNVFLFPSREEGFGIAIAEAIFCGLPVVAWDLPVYSEVFAKGLIQIKIGQIESFANAVILLLKDKEYADRLAEEGRENIRKYNWDRLAQEETKMLGQI